MGLGYLHVIRRHGEALDNVALARAHFAGPLILNDGYDFDEANQVVAEGTAAAISFARAFIGNPDLVDRFRRGAPLARFDPKTLYTPGPEGYTDYSDAPTRP